MKLWVDDIRQAPDDTWTVARTVTAAIGALSLYNFDEISLDHDISHQVTVGELSRPYPCDETFKPVAEYIAQRLQTDYYKFVKDESRWHPKITIHTSNPVGAATMRDFLRHGCNNITIAPFGAANRLEMEV